MKPVISVSELTKTYPGGLKALDAVSLDVKEGEILALLGPNGAGKTTLISIVCGLVNPSSGSVSVGGHDIISDFRAARSLIGLVPQELHVEAFESVQATVSFSRGLFGKPRNPALVEQILKDLSLWDKRKEKIMALSGGMKRRVMIAKALAHEPRILFLDEPTAGVDVELRKSMWELIGRLRDTGVTVILTTHYIEEAENIADRVGVISRGKLLLVEEKTELMRKMGEKILTLNLRDALAELPSGLSGFDLTLQDDGNTLVYRYDTAAERTGIGKLLAELSSAGVGVRDLSTKQSSLEDIFVNLVRDGE
ncbi:MAG: ABC transporter ATP-binding protein [Rhizobiaceae bacterium]|nr:ABC transporter ATP-binding protein [Rhizobiaceae bacterium]